ncbi:MAG: hypothetical protein QOH41_772 [Blastocatellia bacterium]|jgi:hypothetical protein|nr:hypothetical protein [Blastocatellia bacterium]
MELVTYSKTEEYSHEDLSWSAGPIYELLMCSACDGVVLRRYFYHELRDAEDWPLEILYPEPLRVPLGLPDKIETAYREALNLKRTDPNAYAVRLGSVLELVCHDRGAKGSRLVDQIKNLGDRETLPATILELTTNLRHLRNIGAHSESDKLTASEIPLLGDLCRIILEYLYTAPQLSISAKERIAEIEPRV